MRKAEFLEKLGDALQGEVPSRVYNENISYYDNYITQEVYKGQMEEEVIAGIGDPRLIARTIIDSSEAGGNTAGGYHSDSRASDEDYSSSRGNSFHYVDLSKWYWKLLAIVVVFVVVSVVLTILGGVFTLILRLAGPLIILFFILSLFRNMRR